MPLKFAFSKFYEWKRNHKVRNEDCFVSDKSVSFFAITSFFLFRLTAVFYLSVFNLLTLYLLFFRVSEICIFLTEKEFGQHTQREKEL